MKQFQILYKDDEGFLEKLKEIKQWQTANPAYVTLFRIYSEDMDLEHIRHICDCLDDEMPDALYLGCTTNANIMDGALSDYRDNPLSGYIQHCLTSVHLRKEKFRFLFRIKKLQPGPALYA